MRADGSSTGTSFMSADRMSRTFLDTNILVYADDGSNLAKQRKALNLLKEHRTQRTGVVSLQVLQEYFVAVTRSCTSMRRLPATKWRSMRGFDVAEPSVNDILAAIDLAPASRSLVLGCPGAAHGQADRVPCTAFRGLAAWRHGGRSRNPQPFPLEESQAPLPHFALK